MSVTAAIYGLMGESLTPEEKAFFRDADPWGFIVFARNIDRPKQITRLMGELRDCVGRDAPIFIDQEGGRVQRLKAPLWRAAPPAARFGELWDREPELALEAVRQNHRLLAQELRDLGIDCDCAPVVDLAIPGADAVIGDRAFHAEPGPVAEMARAALAGLKDQGVAGVIKHIPGHGRADADSHFALPVVREDHETLHETDFAAFKGVAEVAAMAMTAHVTYTAIDPENCATLSKDVIARIIRGEMGFDGLLMSDDLSMKALSGTLRQRGERALKAGCDMLLHCNGERAEMVEVAHAAVTLSGKALERAKAAEEARGTAQGLDVAATHDAMARCFAEAGLEAPAP
ncbi:MAG: beta-N-acetylhexosaminidase [Glycocaulis sp.]